MNSGAISRRYAKALLAYAKENQKEDLVYRQIKYLIRHYRKITDLRHAIENPTLAPGQKLSLLKQAVKGEETCNELLRFLELVIKEKREKLLLFICYSYLDLYRIEKNIYRGKLVTAVPMPEKVIESLRELITRKLNGTIEFEAKVDPELLGGYILQMGTNRVDASVFSQLRAIKKQFVERNRRIV